VFQTKVVEKIKTHILFSVTFFSKIVPCMRKCKKFCLENRNFYEKMWIFLSYLLWETVKIFCLENRTFYEKMWICFWKINTFYEKMWIFLSYLLWENVNICCLENHTFYEKMWFFCLENQYLLWENVKFF
jgi:hypothetical protein